MWIEFLPSRPVFIEIFGFAIHWYGLLYLLAFLIALALLPRIQELRALNLTRDEWSSAVAHSVIGVLLGGRLGYVFFYEPSYFAIHPREIFYVWQGGMSSHGGFLGAATTLFLFCYRNSVNIRRFADVATVPSAIGLALGRIGNFVNEELYGTVTSLPWAMAFKSAEGLRHPLQIYDAAVSLMIALMCYLHLRKRNARPGKTFALFLCLYSICRFGLEFIREQQYPLIEVSVVSLTRGQLLTLPLFLAGVLFWVWFSSPKLDSTEVPTAR